MPRYEIVECGAFWEILLMFGKSPNILKEMIVQVEKMKVAGDSPLTDRELLLLIIQRLDRIDEMLCELGNMEKRS